MKEICSIGVCWQRRSVDAKVDEELQRKHRADILCWLSPTDFSAQHSDNLERKQEGSGLWFLDDTIFKEWKTGFNTTLFCPGMPGAGKTMMATSVIDHLLVVAQDEIDAVAYIYCDYKNRTDQNSKRLFATIPRQLVQSRNTVPASLLALYKDRQNRGGGLTHSEIINELRTLIKASRNTYFIIDALDECIDEDKTHVKLLEDVCKLQCETALRVLVTSRFVPDIQEKFDHAPLLEVKASDDDINNFLKERMTDGPRCMRKAEELQKKVQDSIVKAAGGM
jgi:Cdc6-like AAA superfamily ATPase